MPLKVLPKNEFARCLANNALLITLVERVITLDHYAGPQKDHIYILCDPELTALRIFATPMVLVAAENIGVRPGTVFTEESCGTNALALAKVQNRLVAVRGEQHYCRLFKDWWCVAIPVKDPSGSILGYLDISIHAAKDLVSTIALLKTLLTLIEKEFLLVNLNQVSGRSRLLPSLPPEVERELTLREQEILQFVSSGLTNEEIATKLMLSIETVKTHRRNIYRKLGVKKPRKFLRKLRHHSLKPDIPI
jgi:transcriptional regulator of acetoin/glycerol metabolism